ncbi:FKBP-type peptidyl-prolyl cis-trans isomerase [Enterobacter cloacae complex sp. ESBL7]|uniref:FKBP-type peptidyl-prolyl cis-trans isomerase n=1 Tax=Enterobacter cloacae complex sp. ESBL7 TaxID=3163325 RepID=UPI0035626FAF
MNQTRLLNPIGGRRRLSCCGLLVITTLCGSGAVRADTLPLAAAAVSEPPPAQAPGEAGAARLTATDTSSQQVEELQQQINALQARLQGLSANASHASEEQPPATPHDTVASPGQGTEHAGDMSPVSGSPGAGEAGSASGNPLPVGSVGAPSASAHVPATPAGTAAVSPAPSLPLPQTAQQPESAISAPRVSAPAPATTPVAQSPDNTSLVPSTDIQRQAYASGVGVWQDIGNSLASQRSMGIELDPNYVMAGVRDAFAGHGLKMSASDISDAINDLNRVYTERAADVRTHQETEGKAYRISFSKQKGAFSDAGAWYRIGNKGKGPHLRPSDMAVLQITGTLPDGTVFDASGRDGQEKTVKVGAMLPAVAIGLQKVGVGGELTVVVPPGKGYGDAGMPPAIPGGATLIFDIVVRDVEGGRAN